MRRLLLPDCREFDIPMFASVFGGSGFIARFELPASWRFRFASSGIPAIGGVGAGFAEFALVEFWLFTDKFEPVEVGRLVSGSSVDGGRFEVFTFETEFVLDRSHAKSKRVSAKIAYIAVFLTNFPLLL